MSKEVTLKQPLFYSHHPLCMVAKTVQKYCPTNTLLYYMSRFTLYFYIKMPEILIAETRMILVCLIATPILNTMKLTVFSWGMTLAAFLD